MPTASLDQTWLAAMLQTTDPLFPIGSYAHSYGLEEFAASGLVHDAASLLHYLQHTVATNLREFELPYLRFAYHAVEQGDFDTLSQLDEEIAAAKLSKELRQASASQGQQRLRLMLKLRPHDRYSELERLRQEKRIVPHHIIVFAAETVLLQTPLRASLTAWAYQTLAAPCAAALKLIRIGQEGAQGVLTEALQSIDSILDDSQTREREFAGAFVPALDIASHRHERSFARLFIS